MKQILIYSIVLITVLIFAGCKDDPASPSNGEDLSYLLTDEFPEAKQEVMETFVGIAQSIKDGDMDKLISYHAYGPKFTEFKNGEPRNGGEANETYERNLFGSVTEVVKFRCERFANCSLW